MSNIPSVRCGEILDILINKDEPITIDSIAEKLNVSNRTVRNDLEELQEYLISTNKGEIVKKPRIGIWIETSTEGRRFLRNVVEKSKNYIQPFSPERRQLYIIRRLLQSSETVTMQLLADELYVSRVTIHKDLEQVDKWLSDYDLTLKRKQNFGIEIEGNESNWRRATAELLTILKNDEELKNMLLDSQDIYSSSRLGFENYIQLKELFHNINVKKIEQILNDAEEKMDFQLTDEAYEGLLIHIAISLERLKQRKDIKMDEKSLKAIREQKEFEMAKWISKQLENEFNIEIPICEIGYIALHVLGAKVQQNFNNNITKNVLDNMDEDILNLTKDIISLIGNILSVDFSDDEKLLIGLVLHLRPTINRIKHGLSLRNPILNDIKNNYPSVFGAAWATSVLFEKHFGIKVNEEEVGYLALHIGAALERINKKTRAVIVCSSGIGTSQLVGVRLQKSLSNLEILDIISAHDLSKIKDNNFDFIISTISLEYNLKPVIHISPLVNERDIDRIKKYITNIENTKTFKNKVTHDPMLELFNEKFVHSKIQVRSKEDIINKLGKALVNGGYVTKDFIASALDREGITSTAVGKGVAIPHGIQEYVLKPAIAMATLEKAITWGDNKVDVVFLLALKFSSGNSTRHFFKRFYAILDNDDILAKIRNSDSPDIIYNILIGKDEC